MTKYKVVPKKKFARAEMRRLFEGGVYSRAAFINFAGRSTRQIFVYTEVLPYYSLPRRMRHNIILIASSAFSNARCLQLIYISHDLMYVEPRPQSNNLLLRRLYEGGVY